MITPVHYIIHRFKNRRVLFSLLKSLIKKLRLSVKRKISNFYILASLSEVLDQKIYSTNLLLFPWKYGASRTRLISDFILSPSLMSKYEFKTYVSPIERTVLFLRWWLEIKEQYFQNRSATIYFPYLIFCYAMHHANSLQ